MPVHAWQSISLFGESMLLLPCAAFVYGWLRLRRAPAAAWHWLLVFGAAATAVLGSKLAFMGWGIGSRSLDFTGFSGHAMMAAAVLPTLCYLAMPAGWAVLARWGAAAGVALAVLVGLSRLALDAHSVSEVAGGLLLGFCASLTFMARADTPHGPRAMTVAALALAVLQVMPATALSGVTHHWVESLAIYLSGRDRPFQRGEWALRANGPPPVAQSAVCVGQQTS